MDRRRYLTGFGGLTSTVVGPSRLFQDGGAGDRGARTDAERPAQATPGPMNGWRHFDVVERGADPEGEEDVTPILEEIVDEEGDNELALLFPPGTYRMETGFEHESFHDFGLLGFNATIEVSSDFEGAGIYNDMVFALGPSGSFSGHNVYLGGFEFDFDSVQQSDDHPASAVVTYGTGSVVFENLLTRNQPADCRRMIELIATGNCRGRIHNCVVGGSPGAGIYAQPSRQATVTITDCLVSGCGDNGFYCSSGSGRVVIENVTAINNEISNVRIGGTVRDSSVFVTNGELSDARGFWLRNGDCRVENCHGYNEANGSRAVLEVAPSARSVTVTDSSFASDSDQRIVTVHEDGEEDEHSPTFWDCTFFGEMDANSTEEAVVVARRGTAFVECSCALTDDVYPIRFTGGAVNCRVIGGRYVSQRPITFDSGRGGSVRDVDLVTDSSEQLVINVPDVVVENVPGEVSEGVRTVVNGVGDNGATDPAEGGDWGENGREGILVTWRDEEADEGRMSVYRNGDWYSWSVA